MFKIKFFTKRIFWIFDNWKTNRMTLFCNLLIERPSYLICTFKRDAGIIIKRQC